MSNVVIQQAILTQMEFDFKSLMTKDPSAICESYLKAMLNDLEETYKHSKFLHSQLITGESSPELETYLRNGTFSKIREAYHNLWAKIDILSPKKAPIALDETTCQQTLNSSSFQAQEHSTSLYSGIKLPRLNIPLFSGAYDDWRNFYNLFISSIHEDKKLKPVQKLQYLQSNVIGDAKNLIKHYALEDQNYEKALLALKEEYDHTRILANIQLSLLFNLPILKTESSKEMKNILQTTTQCLVSLEGLGIEIKEWDCVLIYLIQQKLPKHTLQLWENKLGGSKNIPKYSEFKEFLEGRFRALEMLELPNLNNQNQDSKKSTAKTFVTQSSSAKKKKKFKLVCVLCKGEHILSKCQKFLNKDLDSRSEYVKNNNLCTNCLASSHQIDKCYSMKSCVQCRNRHHTLLHRFQVMNQSNPNNNESIQHHTSEGSGSSRTFHLTSNKNKIKLLGTAQLRIFNSKNHSIIIRALVDPCSDESYVTESTIQLLGQKKYYSPTPISVIGDQSIQECTHRADFRIGSLCSEFNTFISAVVVKSVTGVLPPEGIKPTNFMFLEGLDLADPSFDHPNPIHMLLGVSVYSDILLSGVRKDGPGGPIAENSKLGWIVRGEVPIEQFHPRPRLTLFTYSGKLNEELERFWKLEEVNVAIPKDPENEMCERLFEDSVKVESNGRLCVSIPFRNGIDPILGDSRKIALKRFYMLEKRLNRNQYLKNEYHNTIRDYISQGHMIISDSSCNQGKEYFMPHHAVFKQSSTTTKVRVVFDASCRTTDGTSLNNHMLPGPKLQADIRDVLFKWRMYKYVITSDIAQMYRQFNICKEHHSYQKILWRFEDDTPIQEYFLTTVTFGTTSAPFLAIRLLQYISDSTQAINLPLAAEACKRDFYVDDLLSGAYEKEVAILKQQQLRILLQSFHLHLRKWSSNCMDIIQDIPESEKEVANLDFDHDDFRKTLGIFWSPKSDCFSFSIAEECLHMEKITKRKVLSTIARVFDPLGLISPCIMFAKSLMKRVWQLNIEWDEEISKELRNSFSHFLDGLPLLSQRYVPRWINTSNELDPITLYGFCDASEIGYGAVVYLLNPNASSSNKFVLLTSKTKVAPTNYLSIPRMELCGAVLLSDLLQWVQGRFSQQVTIVAFTDSKIVLSWLSSHPSKWKTFVANRTTQILQWMNRDQWNYIETSSNPADFASRGLLPSELLTNELWWSGPNMEVLHSHDACLPDSFEESLIHAEEKKIKVCLATVVKDNDILNRYSSHQRLLNVVTKMCIFMKGCLERSIRKGSIHSERFLEISECLSSPESLVFRCLQSLFYQPEITALKTNRNIDKRSRILSLNPFLDGNNVLRVGGRLHNAEELSYNEKHPIIIPNKHQVTFNLIHNAHEITLHGTPKETLAYLRHKYHIIKANDRVKIFIHRCVRCFRYLKHIRNELMGTLPNPRVNMSKPFLHTGVDFAGPLLIKVWKGRTKSFYKAYISVFICLCTKAIHIEVVTDLSSQGFLAAFRRFVSRRGRVFMMYSDQGTNFVGAAKLLKLELHDALKSWNKELEPVLSELGTSWKFIPPASPHFGGLWEAGVKSVKSHLFKVIKDTHLTYEELTTVLIQVEGVLNSRPLCPITDNPDDYSVLTPSHFLIGEPIVAPPEPAYALVKEHCLKRWHFIQKLFQQFWSMWSNDYLHRLQRRPKWLLKNDRQFKINDLVLISDERYPPSQWPVARIDSLHPGTDGIPRVVTLRKSDRTLLKRPISKLLLLPTDPEECSITDSSQ